MRRARQWYCCEVIKAIPRFITEAIRWRFVMLINYLKIALRNIKRHKMFSFINISGLAVGMACCILILLWVRDELSYDRFHKKGEQIYKITIESHQPNGVIAPFGHTPFPLAPALKERYPEVVDSARIFEAKVLLRHESNVFNEDRFYFTEPSFFKIFTFPLLKGNPQTALSNMNSVVITENMAQKYFGIENPIGKTLSVNINRDYIVTGVMKNIPANSHITFDFLASSKILENLDRKSLRQEWDAESLNSWGATYVHTYVLLQKTSFYPDVEHKISGFFKEINPDIGWVLKMQPLYQIHLFPINRNSAVVKYLTIFSIIAFVVLMIACINFMNLTTAISSKKSKEIGIRKIVGAKKGDIIRQFFGEYLLLSFFSLALAVLLVFLFLPAFNTLTGKQFTPSNSIDLTLLFGLIGITILTGCVSAVYPALFLSSFSPIRALKGSFSSGSRRPTFRRILVVIQFSLSIILVIGTLIIYSQLDYIRKRDLGYDKENIIYLPLQGEIQNKYQILKNGMVQNANVLNATVSNTLPSFLDTGAGGLDWEGRDPKFDALFNYASVDFDFIDTFRMQIVQGLNFSGEITSDLSNYILNETAIKQMGLNDPIGKRFSMWEKEGKIIGIVKDFNFRPLHTRIEPLILALKAQPYTYIFIRIASENYSNTLKYLESVWNRLNPEYPFDYHFLDEDFDRLYWDEQRLGKIFGYFSFLAIFIACLGLYGLASFVAEERTKEIGIRKVLGSSTSGIVMLLTKDFSRCILLATLIAWPVGYFVMNGWLNNFAYRTKVGFGILIFSSALALIIALLTVSFQSIKAALANPVDSLRYE